MSNYNDVGYLKGKVESMEIAHQELKEQLKSIEDKMDSVSTQITRYKGFLGGVTFVL